MNASIEGTAPHVPELPPCPKHQVAAGIACSECKTQWCDRCIIVTRSDQRAICIECALKVSGVRVRPRPVRARLPLHDWPLPASVVNSASVT